MSLTYKGDSSFKTGCGGCVSILITFFIGVAAIGELVILLTTDPYQDVASTSYVPYGNGTQPWNLTTTQ